MSGTTAGRKRRERLDCTLSSIRMSAIEAVPLNVHPLDPRSDDTVSRIVGRRETQAAALREGSLQDAIAAVSARAFTAIARKPSFSAPDIDAIVALFEERMVALGLSTEMVRAGGRPGPTVRIVRPVSTAEIALGGCARTLAVKLRISETAFQISTDPFLLEWRQHVVDRMHMRAQDRGEGHVRIGSDLIMSGHVLEAVDLALSCEGRHATFPVPLCGGLARGVFAPLDVRHYMVASEIDVSRRAFSLASAASPIYGSFFHPATASRVWRAMTFIGPETMDARADAYVAAFKEAAEALRPLHAAVLHSGAPCSTASIAMQLEVLPEVLRIADGLLRAARASGHGRDEEGPPAPCGLDLPPPWRACHDGFWRGVEEARRARPPRWFKLPPGPVRQPEARERAWWEASHRDYWRKRSLRVAAAGLEPAVDPCGLVA